MKIAQARARSFLAKPDAAIRAVLLFGPNRALTNEAANTLAAYALKGSDDPFATTKLADDDLRKDKARLSDALVSQSLLGGPTLVWVRAENESNADTLLLALKEVEAGAPTGFLLVEGGDLSSSGKLAKGFDAAKRAAVIAFYEESDAERAGFLRELLKEENVAVSPDAFEALATMLAPDRGLMRREIEKLAAFAHGANAPLSPADIDALINDESEGAVDEAALAALMGKPAQAIESLARTEALSGVSALKSLERRLLRLLDARTRVDGGMSAADAAGKLRPPVFWKERDAFQAQLRTWNARRLVAALDVLWAAELRAKTAQSPHELIAADAYRGVAELVGKP